MRAPDPLAPATRAIARPLLPTPLLPPSALREHHRSSSPPRDRTRACRYRCASRIQYTTMSSLPIWPAQPPFSRPGAPHQDAHVRRGGRGLGLLWRHRCTFDFDGVLMTGGCRKAFSKRDALWHHLQREKGKCFGGRAVVASAEGQREVKLNECSDASCFYCRSCIFCLRLSFETAICVRPLLLWDTVFDASRFGRTVDDVDIVFDGLTSTGTQWRRSRRSRRGNLHLLGAGTRWHHRSLTSLQQLLCPRLPTLTKSQRPGRCSLPHVSSLILSVPIPELTPSLPALWQLQSYALHT